ncbi:retrovirus-related pol polyprotein from transposon TNT 1-94 [Tanacetum coccineum]
MTTLAEFMIIAGADNRPPMLEKSLYDSWKSRMELYIENRENGRMILNSLQNDHLFWPTVEEECTTRTRNYKELFLLQKNSKLIVILKLQTSLFKGKFVMDVKLARDFHTMNYDQLYSYLEQHEAHANENRLMLKRYQDPLVFCLLTTIEPPSSQLTTITLNTIPLSFLNKQHNHDSTSSLSSTIFTNMDSCLAVPVFNQGDDQITCLNKAMAFLTAVASLRRQGQSYAGNIYKGNATSPGGNNVRGHVKVVKCYNCQGEGHMARQCTQPKGQEMQHGFRKKCNLAKAQEAG